MQLADTPTPVSETGFCSVTLAGLALPVEQGSFKLAAVLPLPPTFWGYREELPYSFKITCVPFVCVCV